MVGDAVDWEVDVLFRAEGVSPGVSRANLEYAAVGRPEFSVVVALFKSYVDIPAEALFHLVGDRRLEVSKGLECIESLSTFLLTRPFYTPPE